MCTALQIVPPASSEAKACEHPHLTFNSLSKFHRMFSKNLSSCSSPTPASLVHPHTETQGLPAACKTLQQPVTMGCLSGEGAAPFLGAELSRSSRDASCASTAANLEPFMVHGESATRQSQRCQFPLLLAPAGTSHALSCGISYTGPGGCCFALCRCVCEGFAEQSLQTPSDILGEGKMPHCNLSDLEALHRFLAV